MQLSEILAYMLNFFKGVDFMKKKVLAITLAIVCILSAMLGAFAASNNQEIRALLSFGTQIKYNGVVQEFKDAAGNTVYPINYEGTTYLPVRAVCGLANIPVDWDAATGTVLLGEKDKTIVDENLYVKESSIWVDSDYTTDSSKLVMGGLSYDSGIIASAETKGAYGRGWKVGYIKTELKYSTLHVRAAYAGSEPVKLSFVKNDEDGTVLKTINLSNGIPTDIEVDNIVGCTKVYITIDPLVKDNYDNPVVITDMYLK